MGLRKISWRTCLLLLLLVAKKKKKLLKAFFTRNFLAWLFDYFFDLTSCRSESRKRYTLQLFWSVKRKSWKLPCLKEQMNSLGEGFAWMVKGNFLFQRNAKIWIAIRENIIFFPFPKLWYQNNTFLSLTKLSFQKITLSLYIQNFLSRKMWCFLLCL